MDGTFAHHAAHEVGKAIPTVSVVVLSGWLTLPWQ